MVRWEPGSRGRLAEAAMALFGRQGYETTTVAEIAAQAGVTERTFFRHFTDKREVLFFGGAALRELFVDAVEAAPESTNPIDAVTLALHAAAVRFEDGRPHSMKRQRIIEANAELRERELIKLAGLSAALAQALHSRGVAEPTASLAGEAAIAIFKNAFERWVAPDNEQTFVALIDDSSAALRAVVAGR